MLPAFVVEADQRGRRVAAVAGQGGGRPVAAGVAGAVGAGDGDLGADDPHRQVADAGQKRAVIEAGHHRQAALGRQPYQELGLGGGEPGEEISGVEAPVGQHQHLRREQVQQPAGVGGLAGGGRAGHRADQRPGPGLAQGHQFQRRVAGDAPHRLQLAQPGPVPRGVGHLDRTAPVEGHRPVPAKPHPRGGWPGHRPGQHLEQRLERGRAQAAAQVAQRLRRRARHARTVQGRGQLRPHPLLAQRGEQPQRQHEADPHPRRQHPQPPLPPPGLPPAPHRPARTAPASSAPPGGQGRTPPPPP